MALYIDPPRWPAHGTVFSHLISDISLRELHEFAGEIGLDARAFDEDHYDVPREFCEAAINAGARLVSGTDLVRRLRDSGLRVPARERVAKVLPILRRRWSQLEPGNVELGEELLARWNEPHRHYHNPVHLLECVAALDLLAPQVTGDAPNQSVLLAAWFHDAVYEGVAGTDERRSAEYARAAIGGERGDEVARLVLLTRDHCARSDDEAGRLLVDADLAILAAPRARYRRYIAQVRAEYAHVSDAEWREGRDAVLRSFLQRRELFSLPQARQLWEERARKNLAWEVDRLAQT